ncbi:MAG: SidA/IucD/PvdA family monooxygenase [Myxococcales bacterium]
MTQARFNGPKADSRVEAGGSAREQAYQAVAIGCGPFNLGLAALASTLPELDLVAFEAQPELRWHPGLMFEDATFQLSFLADLVTLVDPTHPLSFLAYLRDVDRMYPFFIRERFHPTRREYEDYLRWVAGKLPSVRFGHRVEEVRWDRSLFLFVVHVVGPAGRTRVLAKDLVIGIGTEPCLPEALTALPRNRCVHSGHYLHELPQITRARHLTVVGSGQSAAECALDALRRNLDGGAPLSWITRTPAFAPLDYTKLVLEMTTPAYVRYFHGLPQDTKDRLVREQWQHYKGISVDTLEAIHDTLYQRELRTGLEPVELRSGVAVEGARLDGSGDVILRCRHRDTNTTFEHRTSLVVAATGYRERSPAFLEPLEPLLMRDDLGRYRVRLDYSIELDSTITGRIFVANAELHTHGVATPDLGMCAFRNATILNTITGREVHRLPRRTAFSSFALPAPEPVREREQAVRRQGAAVVGHAGLDLPQLER